MAKFDKILCPLCLFTAKYVNLVIAEDDTYVCPACNASFSHDEVVQLFGIMYYSYEMKDDRLKQQP